jgi:alkanesulfonate monooxygenase SsuD/methylene tetrahydromethanopterin reductase-like flavin-dependent oxidoreductase (luciferase family)
MKALQLGLAPFALDKSGSTATLEPLVAQCTRAEQLGYHSIWIPESHFVASGATPVPLMLLAAVAARTTRLRLGTTSYLLPIRHALHVAEEVAVLDRLSGGRVILGVGRGFRPALFDAFAVPRKEKRDRFEAALDAMQRAWLGEPIVAAAEGAEPITLAPRPVQEPHPPIWVAAFGPKALAQAGRLGLPYLASPVEPLARLVENYQRHREACAAKVVYEDLSVPVMRSVFISRNHAALGRVREALVRQIRALGGGARWLAEASSATVDEVALVGEPQAVADRLARYREQLGVTHLIARAQVPGAAPGELDESIELLAELGCRDGV